jgi:chromosome segregation ATPase
VKDTKQKIDGIRDDITEIKVTLSENTVSLKEHMRRTDASEKRIENLEDHQQSLMTEMNNTNTEIKEHLSFLKGSVKTISILIGAIVLLSRLGLI